MSPGATSELAGPIGAEGNRSVLSGRSVVNDLNRNTLSLMEARQGPNGELILTTVNNQRTQILTDNQEEALDREGLFRFSANTWMDQSGIIPEVKNSLDGRKEFFVHTGDAILINAARFRNFRLISKGISACTGIAIRATKNGVTYYGFLHVYNSHDKNKQALVEQILLARDTLVDRLGFANQDIEYIVDYRVEEYHKSAQDSEMEVERTIPSSRFIFHRRYLDRVTMDDIVVNKDGAEILGFQTTTSIIYPWKNNSNSAVEYNGSNDSFGGIDHSVSLRSTSSSTGTPGGIDFRFLPIVTQSIDSLKASIRVMPQASLERINLIQEWSNIERLVNSGITPSAERLKDYLAASCFKGNLDSDMDKIVSCISDILRMEEETYCSTDPTFKDILVVLGSGRSGVELKIIFNEVI